MDLGKWVKNLILFFFSIKKLIEILISIEGSICGAVLSGNFDQVYVKSEVKIRNLLESSTPENGGLFGLASGFSASNLQLTINNSYSMASLTSLTTKMGGLIGLLDLLSNFTVKIENSYTNVTLSTSAGNTIGVVQSCSQSLSFTNSYFNNQNSFPSIKSNGCPINGDALGLNSLELYNNISTNLPSNLWCKGRLINGKKNFNFYLIGIYNFLF